MARKVKDTPVLIGEDARRFEAAARNPKPITADEKRRILEAKKKFRVIAKPEGELCKR